MTGDSATGAALIRSVQNSPDDDAPSLVLADWLDEQGEAPRAEFIRLSVELARLRKASRATRRPAGSLTARMAHLADRRAELFYGRMRPAVGAYPADWRCLLSPPAYADWTYATPRCPGTVFLSRGLGVLVFARPAAWLTHGDALVAAHPVRHVRLAEWPARAGERRGLHGDPLDRTFTDDELEAAHRTGEPLVVDLLRCRWPSVEGWRLSSERPEGMNPPDPGS